MPTPAEIAAILKTAAAAYPERKPDKTTLQVYVENLEDIPSHLLEAAVKYHIQNSPWFPKISELRDAAHKLANVHDFAAVPPPRPSVDEVIGAEVWPLLVAAQALEDAFYHESHLDPAEWEALALEYERAERHHRAEAVRRKLEILQNLEANPRHYVEQAKTIAAALDLDPFIR